MEINIGNFILWFIISTIVLVGFVVIVGKSFESKFIEPRFTECLNSDGKIIHDVVGSKSIREGIYATDAYVCELPDGQKWLIKQGK